MQNPIDKFSDWWKTATANTPLKQKSAVCVSTIGKDGFPNARFVDLKGVDKEGFKFCSYLDSEKGQELSVNPKVAITVWWDHVGYQVRVNGVAEEMPSDDAEKYWKSRSREAQLTTLICNQSQILESESALLRSLERARESMANSSIDKPPNWGGYVVLPRRMEFLTFREDRLHLRERYENISGHWAKTLLQP